MSYDHIHAVAKRFNGTLAERMVLMAFATHTNPQSGFSTLSIDGCAAWTHISRSFVRSIVRRLEGSPNADEPEPGKWLYPLGKRAMPGDGTRTCYRMFVASYTAPVRRKGNNPGGINKPGGRVPSTGVQGPVAATGARVAATGVQWPVAATGTPVAPSTNPGSGFTVTPVAATGKSIESIESPSRPRPGDVLKALAAAARRSPPPGTPHAVGQSGASPQTPNFKQPAGDGDPIGIGNRSPALPEATDDETDLVLINDHQPPLDPIP